MADVYQIPFKYDMNKHHTFRANSPVKTAFQIGETDELRVLCIHENGIVIFTDDKNREIWSSRALTVAEDGSLDYLA